MLKQKTSTLTPPLTLDVLISFMARYSREL